MIEIKDLRMSFGDTDVLKGLSATFETGKTNMIIGGSGSGKTVLVKCLVGLFKPTAGSILFDGKDFTKLKPKAQKTIRKQIGMLFQYSALFDSMSVEDNVSFPLRMFSKDTSKEIKMKVEAVLERVNLPGILDKFPDEISGGMKKRVGIARSIIMNPKYLFCDEPNSGLDPLTANVIDQLIKEITIEYNTTTIINTHDMNSVMEFADNIVFLYKGELRWSGTREDIDTTDDEIFKTFVYASQFSNKTPATGTSPATLAPGPVKKPKKLL